MNGISVHPESDCVGRLVLSLKLGVGLPVRSKSVGLDRCSLAGLKHSFHVEQFDRCFHNSLLLLLYRWYGHTTDMGVVQASCFLAIYEFLGH